MRDMPEILFRGKRVDNGEWIYGYPLIDTADCSLKAKGRCVCPHDGSQAYIICWDDPYHEYNYVDVIADTIGQYTGLTDKNGVKIFEGDIVHGNTPLGDWKGVIIWIDRIAGFGIRWSHRSEPTAWQNAPMLTLLMRCRTNEFAAEVIGNIHDNPELMEGDGEK